MTSRRQRDRVVRALVPLNSSPTLTASWICSRSSRVGRLIWILFILCYVHTIPDGFCTNTKTIPDRTVISALFLWWREATPRRSRKPVERHISEGVPYFGAVITDTYSDPSRSAPNSLNQPRRHDIQCVWTTCATPGRSLSPYTK